MKLQKKSIILFCLYVLLTVFFVTYFLLQGTNVRANINYSNDGSSFVTVLKNIASAMDNGAKLAAIWFQYVIVMIMINLLYYAILMRLRRLHLLDLIVIIGETFLLGLGLFLLILAIFEWTLGEYFTVTCPLLGATCYVLWKRDLFWQSSERSSE